jgi:hypothetical protein
VKGKMSALWLLKRHPRTYIYGAYTKDFDNGATYYDEVGTDNIFTLAIRKSGVPQKFMMIEEKRFEFFKEYYSGFSHQVALIHRQYNAYAPLPVKEQFAVKPNGNDLFTNMEASVKIRYAWHEDFLEGNFYRFSLGSKYPIVDLQ